MKRNKCKCPAPRRNRASTRKGSRIKANRFRRENLEGREHLVVPVVMLRTDVVMNGGLILKDEVHAPSWNGVPVTIQHPGDAWSEQGSANSPTAITKYAVGRIFNAAFDGVRLKAEAWVDVHKANKIVPGIVARLDNGDPMDVSTGYFSDDYPAKGNVNGREYNTLQRALKPDHLALLPGEIGACSWEDGCGVRANRSKANMPKGTKQKTAIQNALGVLAAALGVKLASKAVPKKNERGDDEDRRTVIADLISNDDSPFTPDDEDALRLMSDDTLFKQRDAYLATQEDTEENEEETSENEDDETSENEEETEANEDEPSENEDEEHSNEEDEEKPAANKNKAKGKANTNSRSKQVKKPKANCSGKPNLNSEDREALAFAKTLIQEKRQGFIARIVANSAMTAKDLEDLSTTKLEKLAGGLRANADFSGRAVPPMDPKKVSESTKAMMPTGFVSAVQNRAKAKEIA